jgi:hypothetical protein
VCNAYINRIVAIFYILLTHCLCCLAEAGDELSSLHRKEKKGYINLKCPLEKIVCAGRMHVQTQKNCDAKIKKEPKNLNSEFLFSIGGSNIFREIEISQFHNSQSHTTINCGN